MPPRPPELYTLSLHDALPILQLLDAHEPGSPLDVMTEMADIVPARVFGWMLGAGEQDDKLFAEWSKALILVLDRKSTRLNSSHANISYAVFCLKKKKISDGDK